MQKQGRCSLDIHRYPWIIHGYPWISMDIHGCPWIGSWIKHIGPCFGMNGHFRRDPDVISRLLDTAIDVPSVFIGFRSSSSVKIVILDEIMTFIWFFIKILIFFSIFYFDPRVIQGRFRHRTSILFDRKVECLWKFAKQLTPKTISLPGDD